MSKINTSNESVKKNRRGSETLQAPGTSGYGPTRGRVTEERSTPLSGAGDDHKEDYQHNQTSSSANKKTRRDSQTDDEKTDVQMEDAQINQEFKEMDTNHDGRVDLGEFMRHFNKAEFFVEAKEHHDDSHARLAKVCLGIYTAVDNLVVNREMSRSSPQRTVLREGTVMEIVMIDIVDGRIRGKIQKYKLGANEWKETAGWVSLRTTDDSTVWAAQEENLRKVKIPSREPEELLREMFKAADTNGDEFLSEEEFLAYKDCEIETIVQIMAKRDWNNAYSKKFVKWASGVASSMALEEAQPDELPAMVSASLKLFDELCIDGHAQKNLEGEACLDDEGMKKLLEFIKAECDKVNPKSEKNRTWSKWLWGMFNKIADYLPKTVEQ